MRVGVNWKMLFFSTGGNRVHVLSRTATGQCGDEQPTLSVVGEPINSSTVGTAQHSILMLRHLGTILA
ncbi:MAG: hypothetical protein DI536_35985 [Archangium gephyra]|uniref:Uncharacterized protein n=1 Tax=Archangium gephyra TaxID=48 RepID=A0A2W5SVK6_9BACT|nr:MAG: hypothetical protein DI536_35985 [Archangium gephyra]